MYQLLNFTGITKLILLFILNLFCSCGNNTSLETRRPTLTDFEIGEKWTWKWQRTINDKVMGEGVDVKEVVDYNGDLGFYFGNSRHDTIPAATMVNGEEGENPFHDWPLKVGKTWKHIEHWENESGGKGISDRNVKIISYEQITVEAGTFWAYKIKYEGTIENLSTGGKAEVTDFWWYSPLLKEYIMHTQDDGYGIYTSELIAYSDPQKTK
ncbi:hypothetical protein [Robertkochia sediminum]|uniref:hypothetical protein n=1 Tax=Robertkochia sediminum TaxID=2785326 RepID=UPI0019347153|nr:hypothetical protein [Robertkochia sediminum]MBL7472912.1 hypothetical protein [Robertkochia sediminum]